MKIQTIHREGEALQFTGENIEEIAEKFNIKYKELRSCTTFKGKPFLDVRIGDTFQEEDLIAGDIVFKDSETNEWSIIPYFDFSEYWRIIE